MKRLSRPGILALLIVSAMLPVLFQNCAGKLRSSSSGSLSPFANHKLQLLPSLTSSQRLINLSILVDESARRQGKCDREQSFVRSYISDSSAKSSSTRLRAYNVRVPTSALSLLSLDPCVVGATAHHTLSFAPASIASTGQVLNAANIGSDYLPDVGQAETRLKSVLNYTSLQARLNTEIQQQTSTGTQPVRIAILGTGIAPSSAEFTNLTPDVSGFNLVAGEKASAPVDDHFVGTGTASLLSATGATQSKIKGLFNGLFEILPFRLASAGDWTAPDSILEVPYLVANAQLVLTQCNSLITNINSPTATSIENLIVQLQSDLTSLSGTVQTDWTSAEIANVKTGINSVVTDLKNLQQMAQSKVDSHSQFLTSVAFLIASVPSTYDYSSVYGILSGFQTQIPGLPDQATQAGADVTTLSLAQALVDGLAKRISTIRNNALASLPSESQRLSIVNQLQSLQQNLAVLQANLATLPDSTGAIAALLSSSSGFAGLTQSVQQALIDTVVAKALEIDNSTVANAILQAVNMGADVIEIPFSSNADQCDPVIGEAINQAIEANVVVVLAGGDEKQNVDIPSADQLNPLATSSPACWGGYFHGALSVAGIKTAVGTPLFSQFSNFGGAMKIAAPDTAIPILDSKLQPRVYSGSAFSSTLVNGAAALLVAYHKNRQMAYLPWMVENLLLSSSSASSTLAAQVPTQKYLDFSALSQTITNYDQMTDSQKSQFVLSGEEVPNQLDGTPASGLIIEGSTNYLRLNDRVQLVAKLVNAQGLPQSTVSVAWSVSDSSALSISSNGILTSASSKLGRFTVTAVSQNPNFSASFDIIKLPILPAVTGVAFLWKTTQTIQVKDSSGVVKNLCSTNRKGAKTIQLQIGTKVDFTLAAFYADGTTRDVTADATILQGAPGNPASRVPGSTSYTLTSGMTGGMELVGYYQGFSSLVDLYAVNGIPLYAASAASEPVLANAVGALSANVTSTTPTISSQYSATANSTLATINFASETNRFFVEIETNPVLTYTDITGASRTVAYDSQNFQYRLRDDDYVNFPLQYVHANQREYINLYSLNLKAGKYFLQLYDPKDDLWGEVQITYDPTPHLKNAISSHPVGVAIANPASLKATSVVCKDPSNSAASPFAHGSGVTGDPYIICTPTQLFQINKYLYDARRLVSLYDGAVYFQLGDNLDLSSTTNLTLGSYSSFSAKKCLLGGFDGSNYAIKNFTYADPQQDYVGLFACIANGARLSNLLMIDPLVAGHDYVGAVSGYVSEGIVANVQILNSGATQLATVSGRNFVGAMVGDLASGSLGFSVVDAVRVSATGNYAGGVSGGSTCVASFYYLLLSNLAVSYSGAPSVAGNNFGGVTGGLGAIDGAIFSGTVSGTSYVAGIGGHRLSSVTFSGTVSGTGDNVAGLVSAEQAVGTGSIEYSTFSGTVSGRFNVSGILSAADSDGAETIINNVRFDGTLSSTAPDGTSHLSASFVDRLSDFSRVPAAAFGIPLTEIDTYRIWGNSYNVTKSPMAPVALFSTALPLSTSTTIVNYNHPGILPFTGNSAGVLTPILIGIPNNPSQQNIWQVFVSGSGIGYYKFKIGLSSSTDCTAAEGYSIPRATNLAILRDMASLPDGHYILCVMVADGAANFVPWSSSSSFSWTKSSGSTSEQLN